MIDGHKFLWDYNELDLEDIVTTSNNIVKEFVDAEMDFDEYHEKLLAMLITLYEKCELYKEKFAEQVKELK